MRRLRNYFIQADPYLSLFSMFNFGYVTYISGFFHWKLQLLHILVFIVSFLALAITTLRFTSWYRRKYSISSTSKPRRRDEVDATLWLFFLSVICLLYPVYLNFSNSFLFQFVFPFVTSTFIAWASYLDGRLLYNAVDTGTANKNHLDFEFKFLKMMIQPITWFYAFTILSVVLGIDKIESIMGESNLKNTIVFGAGVAIIIAQLHYLITARIFIRCEEIMKELNKK